MPENNNEGLSLKELIQKTIGLFRFLISRWVIIVIAGIIGGVVGLLYVMYKKPTYTGNLTFVLSSDSKGSVSGLASLAGQFGVDVNGGNSGAFEGDNIIELLKSRRIVKGALFKYVPEEKNTLINIIGEKAGFFKIWQEDKRLKTFIPFPASVEKVLPVQDSLISVIHLFVTESYLNVTKKDKKLSFYSVSTISPYEAVSIFFTTNLVAEAASMYIDTKVKTAKENLAMLQHEADSLRAKLGGTIYSSVSTVDQTFNLNPALQSQRASVQQNQVQVQVLGMAYGEVIKNLEIAKVTLLKETPLFQIIDAPQAPLVKQKTGKLKGLITGGFLFGFIAMFILICKRLLAALWKG